MNILLSSAGRRVTLAGCFRESLAELDLNGRVLAVDASPHSAAGQLSESFWRVPRCTDPGFIDSILRVCKAEDVQLLVPTIDTELALYANVRGEFQDNGIQIAISDLEAVAIAGDKSLTHQWLVAQGFPTVRQSTAESVLAQPEEWSLPLMAKPQRGSASIGVMKIESFRALELLSNSNEIIVQEFARGDEYTINVFVDRHGRAICAVPHVRLEVRAGEVSKGMTVKHGEMMTLARDIAEALPGARGPINIQCFLDGEGEIKIIEINPRFGGGYPLAHQAGAHFTRWMIEEALTRPIISVEDDWQDGLLMLRYDEAVYLSSDQVSANVREAVLCSPGSR